MTDTIAEALHNWRPGVTDFVVLTADDFERIKAATAWMAETGNDPLDGVDVREVSLRLPGSQEHDHWQAIEAEDSDNPHWHGAVRNCSECRERRMTAAL